MLDFTPQGYKLGNKLFEKTPFGYMEKSPEVQTFQQTGGIQPQEFNITPQTYQQASQPVASASGAGSQGFHTGNIGGLNGIVIDNATGRRIVDMGRGWEFTADTATETQQPTLTNPQTPQSQVTGNPQLDAVLGRLEQFLEQQTQAGKTLNPNIQLDQQTVQRFLDQATQEVEPFYASQIKSLRDELSSNLGRAQKEFDLGRQKSLQDFQTGLEESRESSAGRGVVFSGQRGFKEQQSAEAQQRQLELSATQSANATAGILQQGERTIGTRNISDLINPSFSGANVSLAGRGSFTPTSPVSSFSPGNITGSLERQKLLDVQNLKNYLSQQEQQRRVLNFYQ